MTTANKEFYLELLLPGGIYLPEIVAQFMFLFALSDLARYHPREWLKMYYYYTPEYHILREFV